ncbi:hypothetical protein [Flammeovirga sp. SJP92]|uniref:hypothetical protein n=1 Tax=Flammeovirga sp. SJP92 TaxID=1775430 RepID=UPI000787C038|nr:hypothetical protein [Flammeovirga sp. SJP92]KXX70956.1 hypothetical protein AVL50_10125 [Flammeovirga sp. SJP92]
MTEQKPKIVLLFIGFIFLNNFGCTKIDSFNESQKTIDRGLISIESKEIIDSSGLFDKIRSIYLSRAQEKNNITFKYEWTDSGYSKYEFNSSSNNLVSTFYINDTIENVKQLTYENEVNLEFDNESILIKKYHLLKTKTICLDYCIDTIETVYFSPRLGVLKKYSGSSNFKDVIIESFLIKKQTLSNFQNLLKSNLAFHPDEIKEASRRKLKPPTIIVFDEDEKNDEIEMPIEILE